MKVGQQIELNGKPWVVVSTGKVQVSCVRSDWEKQGFDADTFFNLRHIGKQLPTQPYDINAIARKHIKTGLFSIAPR
ncbi:hypothetical protein [Massilia sp. TN1-12]|uniref:hypothetical protein n=1 Tax=Massilia paldalensis TaxID=3377675 RepID=UPI00385175F5